MTTATLSFRASFPLAPVTPRPASSRPKATPATPVANGLFARLDRESAAGSLPETVAFLLLAFIGAAWPTWEAIRIIANL